MSGVQQLLLGGSGLGWKITQGLGATPTTGVNMTGNSTTTFTITPTQVGSMLFVTITQINASGTASAPGGLSVSDNVDGAWTIAQVHSSADVRSCTAAVAYKSATSSTAQRTVTITNGVLQMYTNYAPGEAVYNGFSFTAETVNGANTTGTTYTNTVTVSGPTPSTNTDMVIGVCSCSLGTSWSAPSGGIWHTLWSCLDGVTHKGDAYAVVGFNPAKGSALSTTFTDNAGNSPLAAYVFGFYGPH